MKPSQVLTQKVVAGLERLPGPKVLEVLDCAFLRYRKIGHVWVCFSIGFIDYRKIRSLPKSGKDFAIINNFSFCFSQST